MITQVKTMEQFLEALKSGKKLKRDIWNDETFIQVGVTCPYISVNDFLDYAGWQIIEDDILVPESVGFCKYPRYGIALIFGSEQMLLWDNRRYKVFETNEEARPIKLSLHKTTFGEVKVGEWFYCGDNKHKDRWDYYLKIDDYTGVGVYSGRFICGHEFLKGQSGYKLVEVKE